MNPILIEQIDKLVTDFKSAAESIAPGFSSAYMEALESCEKFAEEYAIELLTAAQERNNLSAELLRVRTIAHGAAHALDNLAIEFGWGAGLSPMEIADRIRAERKSLLSKAEVLTCGRLY